MSSQLRDRYLWLATGIFLFAAAKGIQYAIKDLIRLTRVFDPPKPSEDDYQDESLENSISVETLKALTEHPNLSIRNAAISILVSQCRRGSSSILSQARTEWTDESADLQSRRRANRAIRLISHWDGDRVSSGGDDGYGFMNPIFQGDDAFIWANDGDWAESAADPFPPGAFLPTSIQANEENLHIAQAANPDLRLRERNDDAEEVERRRRRREAMVFHEGSGQIDENDIFRPV